MSTPSTLVVRSTQFFFIDGAVPDSASLPPDAIYFILDTDHDGLQQMADLLYGCNVEHGEVEQAFIAQLH